MNPAEFQNIARAEREMWWYEGMRRILFAVLDAAARGRKLRRILEAGCGTGFNAALLRERYGWDVVPLDIHRQGLLHAHALGLRGLVQGDLTSLPFAAGCYDGVVSLDVMVHIGPGDDVRAFQEMARVLRPGGVLVVRAAAWNVLRSRHSEFVGERQRYSKAHFLRLASAAGLRVLRTTYANSLLLPLALAKFRLWEPLFNRRPASGVNVPPGIVNRMMLAPLRWEAAWLRRGAVLPLGQSVLMVAERQ